jgi:phosphate butyryltransferase
MIENFQQLRDLVKAFPARTIAVAAAESEVVERAVEILRDWCGLKALLIGDAQHIRRPAVSGGWDIIDEPDQAQAAARAVAAVTSGEADLVVKGACSTAAFMHAVLDPETGLRVPGRIMGQVFMFSTPRSRGLRILSDAAVNIAPGPEEKAGLVENAVRFCRALGRDRPRVALLAALEKVNPRMRDTVEAAETAAMEDRWRELGCEVAGPISVDVAVSPEAAAEKGVDHPVAGHADIFIAPDLASANLFAKGIIYFADTASGGIVLGGRAPAVLRSRADTVDEKVDSICMGLAAAERMAE